MSGLVDIKTIVTMLAGRIDSLVHDILPRAQRSGQDWFVGSVHGEAGKSLAISRRGHNAGVWKDFAADVGGDALDLVAHVMCGGDVKAAIAWSRKWLGIDDFGGDRRPLHAAAARARAAEARKAAAAKRETQARARKAKALWLAAAPLAGTPAEDYLRARHIDFSALKRMPAALRFLNDCYCAELDGPLPAMLAAVHGPDGFMAVHRTYLERIGGQWLKARLDAPKKVYGSYRGAAIRLWRPPSAPPLRQARIGECAILCEGIEDGLSLAMAAPGHRVLAAISLSNLGAVVLPANVNGIIIAADNDWNNPAALAGLDKAVGAHRAAGRSVRVIRSTVGKDFNDLLAARLDEVGAA